MSEENNLGFGASTGERIVNGGHKEQLAAIRGCGVFGREIVISLMAVAMYQREVGDPNRIWTAEEEARYTRLARVAASQVGYWCDPVEEAAIAIWNADRGPQGARWGEIPQKVRDEYMAVARADIEGNA